MNADIPDSYPHGALVASGETVTLDAVPAEGFRFVEWTGDLEGESATATLVMTCLKTVTAIFAPVTHSLTTSVEGDLGGAVRMDAPPSAEGFVAGSEVTLIAEAEDGYTFSHWSGDASGRGNPATIVLAADASAVAHFRVAPTFPWWMLAVGGVALALPVFFIASRRSAGRAR